MGKRTPRGKSPRDEEQSYYDDEEEEPIPPIKKGVRKVVKR